MANSLNYYRFPGSRTRSLLRERQEHQGARQVHGRRHAQAPDRAGRSSRASRRRSSRRSSRTRTRRLGQAGDAGDGHRAVNSTSLDPTNGAELPPTRLLGRRRCPSSTSRQVLRDETSEALAFRAGAIDLRTRVDRVRVGRRGRSTEPITRAAGAAVVQHERHASAVERRPRSPRRRVRASTVKNLIAVQGARRYAGTTFIPGAAAQARSRQRAQVDAADQALPQYRSASRRRRLELAKSAYPNGFSATIDTELRPVNWLTRSQAIAGQPGGDRDQPEDRESCSVAEWFGTKIAQPDTLGSIYGRTADRCTDPSFYAFYFLLRKNDGKPGGTTSPTTRNPRGRRPDRPEPAVEPGEAPGDLREDARAPRDGRAVHPAVPPGREAGDLRQVHVADVRQELGRAALGERDQGEVAVRRRRPESAVGERVMSSAAPASG